MEYRLLGPTGVRVSKLCLGCWMFGTRTDEAESERIVNAGLDAGINFLDTSNRYGLRPEAQRQPVAAPAPPRRTSGGPWSGQAPLG